MIEFRCERSARTRRRAPNLRSAGGREKRSAPSCNVRHAAGGSSRAAHTSLALALSVSTLGEGDPWRRRSNRRWARWRVLSRRVLVLCGVSVDRRACICALCVCGTLEACGTRPHFALLARRDPRPRRPRVAGVSSCKSREHEGGRVSETECVRVCARARGGTYTALCEE